MAPCTSNGECASGLCDDWCVARCSSDFDCIGDGNGTVTGFNGTCITANDGLRYCFPGCAGSGDCSDYPATSCQVRTNPNGFDYEVCTR